jgi:integrase
LVRARLAVNCDRLRALHRADRNFKRPSDPRLPTTLLRVTNLRLRPSLGAARLTWKIWPPVGFGAHLWPLPGPQSSKTRIFTGNPMTQSDVYRMIRRRTFATEIRTRVGNHSFRATGITQYLKNGGRREIAQQMAAHESPRTTALYDRRDDEVAVDEVERILI